MESTQYFSIVVLVICAIHLAVTIGGRVASAWQALVAGGQPSQRMLGQSGKGVSMSATPHKHQRSDWYVFFHCADLVGKEPLGERAFDVSARRSPLLMPTPRPPAGRPENRLTIN